MKKRFICFLIAAVLLLVASTAFMIGCAPDSENVDYSVTVLDPDGEPVNGITVTWQQDGESKGSAVTGEDGKATVSLPASTYTIVLDVDPSLSYTSVSVGTTLRSPTLELTYTKVTYQATVTDKDGAPAAGVTVSWMNGTTLAGDAQTNAEGVASCELNYGDYTVTIADLPEDNIYNGDAPTVTGANSSAHFELVGGNTLRYNVTVTSEGGLLFKRFRLLVYKDETPVTSGWTDENGVYSVSLEPGNYTVRAASLDNGYTTQAVSLTETTTTAQMVLRSTVISTEPASDTLYVMGSIIHDYTFTTPYEVDGSRITLQISELLKTKKAILINNWGTNCTYCVQEMPAMDEAYALYKDDIEMIAVSNYMGGDSDSVITRHYQQYGYSFPMVRDTVGLAAKFGLTAWPTTVVIDRYGAIARIESGAILDKEIWGRLINKFLGDDYVQTFTPGESTSDSITTEIAKPDITVPDDHYDTMATVLNNTDQFPEGASVKYYGSTYEYSWPYVIGTVEDISPNDRVVYAGGTGRANSMSVLYATVTIGAGKVFTFDYYSDTEQDSDVLSVLWDNKVVKEISGYSNGWQTCRLYADIAAGAHTLEFIYIKDSSGNADADNVFLRNVRFTELSELTEPTNMLRAAAYGVPEENAKVFPYYASVALNQADGYYHVTRSQLLNSNMAGNDDSPMLFVSLLNTTNWSYYSVRDLVYGIDPDTGNYKFDLTMTVGNVTKDYRPVLVDYLSTASKSDIYGFLPVDAELHDLLVAFTQKLSEDDYHANDWLELCYFYSHYGDDGEFVGNPIMGLTKKTAIAVEAGTNTADLTRIMAPFPTNIYSFTPSTSGVYRIQSLIPQDQNETYAAQIWLYDDATDVMDPLASCGEEHVVRDGVNEHNFDLYRYLVAGHKYYLEVAFQMMELGTYDFSITLVGNSATILTPASYQFYWQVLDDQGNFTGAVELAGAVGYRKDAQGYYHSVNPDGTTGGYIYLDVKYALNVLGERSMSTVVDMYAKDPANYTDLTYKMFDFRKRVAFYTQTDAEGNEIVNYDPNFNMTDQGAKYIDYTARVKEIIASAPESGNEEGLVPVTQEIVDILTLYIEMRNNALIDYQYELALENEWLRFCWYYRVYDQNNV